VRSDSHTPLIPSRSSLLDSLAHMLYVNRVEMNQQV